MMILSTAIPHQGGLHHVNDRFPGYCADLFHQHGFIPLDFIRGMIWSNPEVLWYLRQNILVFARENRLGEVPLLLATGENSPPWRLTIPMHTCPASSN